MQLLVFLSLFLTARAAQINCPGLGIFTNDPPFDHLPLPECQETIQTSFNLYTRSNRYNPQPITRTNLPSVYKHDRRTVFVIHGYLSNANVTWMPDIKNALLTKGDFNIVLVDWYRGAGHMLSYAQSASNTRVVGAETAHRTKQLMSLGTPRENLWCVGHSLGAHACGHGGKLPKGTQWGRITGMDPAGRHFDRYSRSARLDHTDGMFVDVIHTAGKGRGPLSFGTMLPLGHVDFYPNGGGRQPGCIINKRSIVASDKGDVDHTGKLNGDVLSCSHSRAQEYFLESIHSACQFTATSNCTTESAIPESCESCGDHCNVMGYQATKSPTGKFLLTTNSAKPYCLSPSISSSTTINLKSILMYQFILFFACLLK